MTPRERLDRLIDSHSGKRQPIAAEDVAQMIRLVLEVVESEKVQHVCVSEMRY